MGQGTTGGKHAPVSTPRTFRPNTAGNVTTGLGGGKPLTREFKGSGVKSYTYTRVINGVEIEKPKSFLEAVTITTQILLAVSSSSYGSATFSFTHLAPFLQDSYNHYMKKYKKMEMTEDDCKKYADIDLKEELSRGIKQLFIGLNASLRITVKAPSICKSLAYIGLLSILLATIILPRLYFNSLKSLDKQKVVITSLAAVISNDVLPYISFVISV